MFLLPTKKNFRSGYCIEQADNNTEGYVVCMIGGNGRGRRHNIKQNGMVGTKFETRWNHLFPFHQNKLPPRKLPLFEPIISYIPARTMYTSQAFKQPPPPPIVLDPSSFLVVRFIFKRCQSTNTLPVSKVLSQKELREGGQMCYHKGAGVEVGGYI